MRDISKFKGLGANELLSYMLKHGDKEISEFIWSCEQPMCAEWGEFGNRIYLAHIAYQRSMNFSSIERESPQSWKYSHIRLNEEVSNYCASKNIHYSILSKNGGTFTVDTKLLLTCFCGNSWESPVGYLLSANGGCVFCSGRRCSKGSLENIIKGILIKDALNYSLIGWVDNKPLVSGKLHMTCHLHGEFFTYYRNFVQLGTRCPVCNKSGFSSKLPAKFYLLEISDGVTPFLGYGITRKLDLRLQQHRKSMSDTGFKILSCKTWDMQGSKALEIENKIKTTFKPFPNKIKSFTKESAYLEDYKEIANIVDSVIT